MANKDYSVGYKFTGDSSGFQRAIDTVTKKVGGLGTASIALNQFLELGKKGWEAYKTVMASTEGTADKLEEQISLLNGAMQGVVRTLATEGLLSGLGSYAKNMTNSAIATREMTKALDELENVKAGNSITTGRLNLDFREAITGAAETTDPKEKAKFLEEAIAARKQITSIEVQELGKRLGITEDYYKKISGYGDEYFSYFLKMVPTLAQEYEKYFGKNSVQLEGAKIALDNLKYIGGKKGELLVGDQKTEFNRLQSFIWLLEDFKMIQDDLSKSGQWNEYIRGIGDISLAAADGEKAIARLTKQLTTASAAAKSEGIDRILGPSRVGGTASPTNVAFAVARSSIRNKGLSPDMIPEMTGNLKLAQTVVGELSNSFESLFTNVGGGFRGMVASMMDSLKLLFAQLVGKAALFGLLQLLFPGSGLAVGALTGLRQFVGIPGFAGGTNFTPGGLAMVGERGPELVNLPRGSQVIPNGSIGGQLTCRVSGADLEFVLNRRSVMKGINT